MTIERELVRIAMSFTAGIIISAIATSHLTTTSTALETLALGITAAGTAFLLHRQRTKLSSNLLYLIITMIFLCLGYFISDSERLFSLCNYSTDSSISAQALRFGKELSSLIEKLPFEDRNINSLIKALITGDRSGLSTEITAAFRQSGGSHILALSGLHLGIIYGILKWMISIFGNGKSQIVLRGFTIIAICGFYTSATGASASIIRAFIFISLNEIASVSGRFRNTGSILWTALFLQLFFCPASISDVGFQLSYAAMAGIAYIYPKLKKIWPERNEGTVYKGLKWIWNSAAMSISCQITTGPLAWVYFGTFPQYFLLTNLIALPLVGLIIPSSLLIIGLDICGICPDILVKAVESMVCGLVFCLRTIAEL